jgi:molecular chaperone DnaJ
MKLSEAYKIINLSSDATPEEVKKQYKKLAKEFHPDVNKAPDAEATFKKISEAYQTIQAGKDEPPVADWGGFNNQHIYDIFNRNGSGRATKQHLSSNIDLYTTISFRDAVQGCKIEITYSRQIKCPHCQGSGNKPTNNGCKTCGGQGQVVSRNGSHVFIRTCSECLGRSQSNPCTNCSSTGLIETEASVHVSVPAAMVDGNVLRLQGMGNFAGTFMGLQDQYTDVHLRIKVTPEPGLRLEGKDVVSDLHLTLLDALRGCDTTISTIDGSKVIEVNAGIKNKEEIVLSVGGHNIKHRVIVHVEYPANIDNLIDVLSKEAN